MRFSATPVFCIACVTVVLAQSGGYSARTEEQMIHDLPAKWNAVLAQHPETLPATAPAKDALKLIDASDAAWRAYLLAKEAIYKSQAARLEYIADTFSRGSGMLQGPELAPVMDDLQNRIDSARQAIERLSKKSDARSLAESAALKADLRALEALRAKLLEAQKLAADAKDEGIDAEAARQGAAAVFSEFAERARNFAAATVEERGNWCRYHALLRSRYSDGKGGAECPDPTP